MYKCDCVPKHKLPHLIGGKPHKSYYFFLPYRFFKRYPYQMGSGWDYSQWRWKAICSLLLCIERQIGPYSTCDGNGWWPKLRWSIKFYTTRGYVRDVKGENLFYSQILCSKFNS